MYIHTILSNILHQYVYIYICICYIYMYGGYLYGEYMYANCSVVHTYGTSGAPLGICTLDHICTPVFNGGSRYPALLAMTTGFT